MANGDYLIKGGAVITVDPALGTLPKADILVRDGAILEIGADLAADGAEVIDAADMIVMPGLIDTHYHMWSTLGRNFLADGGFEYFPAKWATAEHYRPEDFHNSVMLGLAELANGGVTCVHNWSHNNRSPAHVDAELEAHRLSGLRARYSLGHVDRMPPDEVNAFDDLERVQAEWFSGDRLGGLVHLGVNLRGTVQSEARVFHEEMQHMLKRGLAVSIHANQTRPCDDDAADYERRGYLGPKFLFCHYLHATDSDREAMARSGTPLSFATHSEFRLGNYGDPRASLIKARAAGVPVSLSSDASSIAPLAHIEATVVQSATPANVDTVIVDGRIVKRGGALTAIDVPAVVARAKESAARVRAAAGGVLAPAADGCGTPIHRAAPA